MKTLRTLLLLMLAVAAGVVQLRAGGPLAAVGTTARKYASGAFPLTYRIDQGTLGAFSNATAAAITVYAFWEWDSVQSAALSFTNGTQLARDVTAGNDAYISGAGQFSDGVNPIVFDTDGSITDAKLGTGAKNSVLGFAASAYSGTAFLEGYAIINGYLSGSGTTTDEDRYKATITHEIGHFLGLAHSQVTMHGDFATMYPSIQKTAMRNISPDDTAAIAWLYPATGHASNVGSISGTVRTPAGTNLGGVVVLAVDSVTGATYSTVVDYFSGGAGGFSSPPSATGSYSIAGLPPGRYFVRIEPPRSQFSGGSSLASYSTPQNTAVAREWFNGPSESGDMLLDDQNQKTGVVVTAGSATTGVDIVSNESSTTSPLTYHNATASSSWPLPFGTYTGYAVRYTAPSAGSLVGVRVLVEGNSTLPLGGSLTVTVHASAAGSLAGVPGTALGSVTIPFAYLSTNQENEIWLRGLGTAINFATGADFHVALTSSGGGIVSLRSDNGATTANRTSYYTSANGWQNMPQGMAGGTPGYNLHMSAIYSTSLAGNPTPSITLTPTSSDFGRVRPNLTADRVFTIANPGTASLSVSALGFTGADASAFSVVAGGAPFTVAPNATHQVTVRFTSRRGGSASKSAALSITSNAPTSPTTATLTGTVIDPVATKVVPSIAFGSKRVDSVFAASYTVLRNTGNDTLDISSITLGGADAGSAITLLSPGGAMRVAPDSVVNVRLQFMPDARRTFAATLAIAHDDSTGSTSFGVTGTGIAPMIGASSDSLAHGSVRVQSGSESTLWIRNTGNAPMSLDGFGFVGADSSVFTVLAPATLPLSVAAGDSVQVRVRFAPTARRGYAATLRARTDALPPTKDFTVSGRGIAPVVMVPSLSIVGWTSVGTTIEAPALAIRNIGDAPMAVSSLTLAGAHATEFTILAPALPATIAPGDSAVVRVRFAPTAAGNRTADVIVMSDDPFSSTVQTTITASGLQGQVAIAGGDRLDFGDVTIATTVDRTARIANAGTAPLTITGIVASGAATFTIQSPSLPLVVQPGDTALLPVRFAPTAAGAVTATVAIASNGVDASVELTLVGRGVAPGLALDRSAIAFGTVPTSQSRLDSFAVRNTGALPLAGVAVTLSGTDVAAFAIVAPANPFTVAPGAEQMVVVRLIAQSSAGVRGATARVTATGGAVSDVALSASVVESMLATVASLDFGTHAIGTTSDSTIAIRNTGAVPLRIDSIAVTGVHDGSTGTYFVATLPTPETIAPGEAVELRVRFAPSAGAGSYDGQLAIYTDNPPDSVVTIDLSGAVRAPSGVKDAATGVGDLAIGAIRPNPATTAAVLSLRTPRPQHVELTIVDLSGRIVATPFSGQTSGRDDIRIDASALRPGDYLVVIRSASGMAMRRLVVVR